MLPIGDENAGQRRRPIVIYALIVMNVAIFLYELTLDDRALALYFDRWAVTPAYIADGSHLYTLITCAFLHGGWLHLGGNMLFLWVFGDNVEDVFGHIGFILFYAMTAVAASGLQVLIDTGSRTPLVGASGAIAGVLAAYIVLFPHGRVRTLFILGIIPLIVLLPAWILIGLWILLQFFSGFSALSVETSQTAGVAYFAHIGGFIAGLPLALLFRNSEAMERQRVARRSNRTFDRRRASFRAPAGSRDNRT